MSDQSPAPSDPAPSVSEGEAVTSRRRVLSGMRPTGAMHLGHWHGALKNWVRLQDQYECFFFAADWHALTTHYEEREVIESSVYDMVTDWLAAGLDPDKVHALHPEPPARARRAVHAAGDGDAARLARAHADLQGPDGAAQGPRPRDLRLPRLSAPAGRRHPDLQGGVRAGRRRPGAARRDHARGRAPLQPPLRPRARLRRARQGGAQEARQGAREGIRGGSPGVPRGRRHGSAGARPGDHRGERLARRQRPRAPRRPPSRHRQDDPGRARRPPHGDLEAASASTARR